MSATLSTPPTNAGAGMRVVADPSGETPILRVQGLTKRFGGLVATRDISFTVHRGEIVGILGPNGAGKTTLYNLLTGFIVPDEGVVEFRGRSLRGVAPFHIVREGIVRTFQLCRPFVGMSVLENVHVGGLARPAAPGGRRAHALRLIEQVGLAGKEDMRAELMAYGDQRRLEIARALAADPALLLLDEPFAGLGAAEIEDLSDLIRRLHRQTGVTVLLIEHKLNEFMKLVERVIALDFGEIIADGTPAEIVADPRVVAAYIGAQSPEDITAPSAPTDPDAVSGASADAAEPTPDATRSAPGPRPVPVRSPGPADAVARAPVSARAPLLEVEDLSVWYGKAIALEGVSLQVGAGEIVAVLGPNGAGKTTLLKAVSRMQPSQGRLVLNGRDIQPLGAHEVVGEGICHCPEGRRLFTELSVLKNLQLGAYRRRDTDAVEHDLEFVYTLFPVLRERATQIVNTLSGGEQQMVAISRALMGKPALLLLDEPSVGIAHRLKMEIFDAIGRIRASGTAILMAEQDAQSALRIADRVYVLEHGHIGREGTAAELARDDYIRQAYLGVS